MTHPELQETVRHRVSNVITHQVRSAVGARANSRTLPRVWTDTLLDICRPVENQVHRQLRFQISQGIHIPAYDVVIYNL
jgi:hypothetical protein